MTEVNKTPLTEDFGMEAIHGGGFKAVGPEHHRAHRTANYIGSAIASGAKWIVTSMLTTPIILMENARPEEFAPDSQAAPPEEPR
jgi:hypothetical protein